MFLKLQVEMIKNNTNKFVDKTNEDDKRIDLFSDRLRKINFVTL